MTLAEHRYTDVYKSITLAEQKLYDIPFFAHVFNNSELIGKHKTLSIEHNFNSVSDVKNAFGLSKTGVSVFKAYFAAHAYWIPYNEMLLRVTHATNPVGKGLRLFCTDTDGEELWINLYDKEYLTIIADSVDTHWDTLRHGFVNDGAYVASKPSTTGGEKAAEEEAERQRAITVEQQVIRDKENEEKKRREAAQAKIKDDERIADEKKKADADDEAKQRALAAKEAADRKKEIEEQGGINRKKETERQHMLAEQQKIDREKEKLTQLQTTEKSPAKGQSPAPTKRTTLDDLKELQRILREVETAKIKPDNVGLTRFLTAFNAVYCFEVAPAGTTPEITPIYLNAGFPCRVRRISVEEMYRVQIVLGYVSGDVAMDFLSIQFDSFLAENLTGDAVDPVATGLLRTSTDDLQDNIALDYTLANPVFGQIQRVVTSGISSTFFGSTVTWEDSNGLNLLLGIKSWSVDVRHIIVRETETGPVTRSKGYTKLSQPNVLSTFLFSSSTARTRLKAVITDKTEPWDAYFSTPEVKQQQIFDAVLREVREQSEDIYFAVMHYSPTFRLYALNTELDEARLIIENLNKVAEKAKRTTAELERLKRVSEIKGVYYSTLLDSLTVIFNATELTTDLVDTLDDNIEQAQKTLDAAMQTIPELVATEFVAPVTTLQSGFDVVALNEKYSSMIGTNLFKGKYSIELAVTAPTGGVSNDAVFDATLKHCNTFSPQQTLMPGGSRFYGAAFDKKTPLQYRRTLGTTHEQNVIESSGQLKIGVRDEQGKLLKSATAPFNVDMKADEGHLFLMQTAGVKLFMTRVDTTHVKLKMIAIDV